MVEKSVKNAPENTSELLSGVNIFQNDLEILPQVPLGPMICDEKIDLNKNELRLLSCGPKFMVRDELALEDFKVEMEKMVAKQKYENAFNEDDLSDPEADMSQPAALNRQTNREPAAMKRTDSEMNVSEKCGVRNEFNLKWEENICNMPYNNRDKVLDLGNLRATQYKHNKTIYLPQHEKPHVESAHEARRNE